jgi:hypothetical protein
MASALANDGVIRSRDQQAMESASGADTLDVESNPAATTVTAARMLAQGRPVVRRSR